MRVTQWGEYGIHCAAYIGKRLKDGAASVPAAEIAQSQGIALDYAQQILQRLRKNNVVVSVRGPSGGYKLAKDAANITLKDVLAASEGDTFEVICDSKPLNSERCSGGKNCNLRPIWFALKDHVNDFLSRYSLADIIDNSIKLPLQEGKPVQIRA